MAGLLVQFDGLVLVTVVEHWSVVGRIDDQGVLSEAVLFELGEDAAGLIVERHHGVTTRAQRGLAGIARVVDARHMVLVRGVVEEERLVLVACDEAAGLVGEGVAHRLVVPERGLAALHPADAADAVDERHVMAVRPIHLQLRAFSIGGQVGVAWVSLLIADFDRVLGVEADDGTVFHEDRRHAVAGGGHDEGVSEADLIGRRVDLLVPVHIARAEAEVPLTHDAGRVTELGEAGGHRRAARFDDEACIAG